MNKDNLTGGYDGKEGEKSPSTPAPKWEVKKVEKLPSIKIVAQLLRNGEPMGLLYFDSEEEFHTIRKRVEEL